METSDARKLVGAALEERRKSVIRLYQSCKYKTYQEIAEVSGVHRNTVSIWIRNWQRGGNRTLKTQKRGRPVGCCRRLLPHEEAKIRRDIVDHCPDQLKLPFALWTRQAIRLHIKSSLGMDLPIRTVGEYLRRWNFTPQKPIKRAYQRNDAAVQNWLDSKFPEIKKQAKAGLRNVFSVNSPNLCRQPFR